MKMKAAVLHSTPGKLAVEEIDIADPGPGEVRVKIAASGDEESKETFEILNPHTAVGFQQHMKIRIVAGGRHREETFHTIVIPDFIRDLWLTGSCHDSLLSSLKAQNST